MTLDSTKLLVNVDKHKDLVMDLLIRCHMQNLHNLRYQQLGDN